MKRGSGKRSDTQPHRKSNGKRETHRASRWSEARTERSCSLRPTRWKRCARNLRAWCGLCACEGPPRTSAPSTLGLPAGGALRSGAFAPHTCDSPCRHTLDQSGRNSWPSKCSGRSAARQTQRARQSEREVCRACWEFTSRTVSTNCALGTLSWRKLNSWENVYGLRLSAKGPSFFSRFEPHLAG